MFPIPWNFPLRKKNGNLVNIGDAIDAGTEIPEHGEGDAGKVLSVDENGDLEWSNEVNTEIQTLTNEIDGGWYKGRNLWNDSNVSGTGTEAINLKNPLPAGTYTFSAIVTSSDTDADTCLIYDVSNSASLGYIARSVQNNRVAITFTIANAVAVDRKSVV